MVITIGREFGSGGRTIGKKTAKRLGISYYDKELIRKIVREELKKIFDAVPKLRESEPVYESIEDKLAHRVAGVRSIPGATMCNELLQSIKDTISNQESEL